MFWEGYRNYEPPFEQIYRCYPSSRIESGDKIIMPQSAIDRLVTLDIEYPMLFELRNEKTDHVSHCSVLEFTAEEGQILMPTWMMQNLKLEDAHLIRLKSVSLPRGTYLKLQPHTKDFLDISNQKAVLEKTLRGYSCLTAGDRIVVPYNNRTYFIDVVEARPASAVSIIETDCEVEFAPPLDFESPPEAPKSVDSEDISDLGFRPFSKMAKRLDGKPLVQQQAVASEGTIPNARKRSQGKLVFGVNGNGGLKKKEKVSEVEVPVFRPFSGNKRCLRG